MDATVSFAASQLQGPGFVPELQAAVSVKFLSVFSSCLCEYEYEFVCFFFVRFIFQSGVE